MAVLGRIFAVLFAALLLALGSCATGPAQVLDEEQNKKMASTPLIPRDILFGNPERAAVRVSPDGKWLAWLAPRNGVMNVWAAPIDSPDKAKAVTRDKKRGVRQYFWSYNPNRIVYLQDKEGDENWRAYSVHVKTREQIDLTPLEGVRARVIEVSPNFPKAILVGLNDRDPRFHDVYRIDLETGERHLVEQNDQEFAGYVTDKAFRLRLAQKYNPDGSIALYRREEGEWKNYLTIPEEDTLTTSPIGFDGTGRKMFMVDSRGRDTSALVVLDMETGEKETLAANEKADVSEIMQHPTKRNIQAVGFDYARREFKILDDSIREDIKALEGLSGGELMVTSRTLDDTKWIAAYIQDDGPVEYFLWNRQKQEPTYLFTNQPKLEGLPLAPMKPVLIESRDGLELVSYLTVPAGIDTDEKGFPLEPLPMVLLVHGGPWSRDSWGYNSQHQLLANRGYAVLSVNFRGSTGFGKNFTNLGNREWAGKMHDDLLDAVNFAVENGIAREDKVAIMGGSYGGYATLAGLAFTPDVFACGVDIVGPSNLITLLESVPPYWAPALQMFRQRVGDNTTPEGIEFLKERSPLTYADRIRRPLLIAQGANDPRVKQAESDQIVDAMKEKNIPVTYVLYPDEGHGFARPENRIAFMAVTEAFLAENLGGRSEPIGKALKGSSITVPEGASAVPGLSEKLR